jgi:hypothetical protein
MNACRSVCGPTCLPIPALRGDAPDDPPGPVPIQPVPARVGEDRPFGALAGGQVDRPGGARRERGDGR